VLQCDAIGMAAATNATGDHLYIYTNLLQCVAVCCSVLQCVAVCCSVLQCVAACCKVLQSHVIGMAAAAGAEAASNDIFIYALCGRALVCVGACCSVL